MQFANASSAIVNLSVARGERARLACAAAFVVLSSMLATVPALAQQSEKPNGAHVYMNARCFVCHGEYGFGGVGPRLRENRFLGAADYVVSQILIGRGVMPSFADALDDQQIAAVASYIRTSWGNDFGDVNKDAVANARKEVQLHPPKGRPHLPPASHQPPHAPVPPESPQPPGQARPPANMK